MTTRKLTATKILHGARAYSHNASRRAHQLSVRKPAGMHGPVATADAATLALVRSAEPEHERERFRMRRPHGPCPCGRLNARRNDFDDGKCGVWPFCERHRDDVLRGYPPCTSGCDTCARLPPAPTFNIGDIVRDASMESRGEVIAIEAASDTPIVVNWKSPRSLIGKPMSLRPRSLRLVTAATIPAKPSPIAADVPVVGRFKVGDRVRIVGNRSIFDPKAIGTSATICDFSALKGTPLDDLKPGDPRVEGRLVLMLDIKSINYGFQFGYPADLEPLPTERGEQGEWTPPKPFVRHAQAEAWRLPSTMVSWFIRNNGGWFDSRLGHHKTLAQACARALGIDVQPATCTLPQNSFTAIGPDHRVMGVSAPDIETCARLAVERYCATVKP